MDFAKIEEEEEDHFSFPVATTRNPPPHFMDSPPLWWHPISPTFPHQNPDNSKGKAVANELQNRPDKYSFQDSISMSTDKQRQLCSSYDDVDEGEKMDLLWEDLNEEFISAESSSPGREVKMICDKGSKTRQDMSERRLSILMLFKLFKKVFATPHYSRNSVKKPHRT